MRKNEKHKLDTVPLNLSMKSPRLEFTAATKRAAWERAGGRCEGTIDNPRAIGVIAGTLTLGQPCLAPIDIGCFHYDHRDNVWTSQDNSLGNCQVLCIACHKFKTKNDVKQIAKTKRIIKKAAGRKVSRHPLPFGRGSKLMRKLNGTIVAR